MLSRKRIHEIINVAKRGDEPSHWIDIFLQVLILTNIAAVIAVSVPSIRAEWRQEFFWFEWISMGIFAIEYIIRVWSCVEEEGYSDPIRGRLRYMARPMMVLDGITLLSFGIPSIHADLRFLRIFRAFRIFRMGRYYGPLEQIGRVYRLREKELIGTTLLLLVLLVFSSCAVYYCETNAQPELFTSIPATMWWAMETLTTIGYGDMYPVTTPGRIFTGIIAFVGIGLFALPAGILGSGFVELFHRAQQKPAECECPKCGEKFKK